MNVSIDIGTSYSSICILGPDGKTQPVDISTGASMFGSKYSMPTAVFVEEDGSIQVGQAALNSRRHTPQNFRMEFKRNLGEDTPILLGGRSFKPEDLYTEIFRHMKARAEKVTGEPVGRAILTYPASYGEMRREKLCTAAKAAGLFDLQLVDEPTAAAMCYCAQGYVRDGQALLVYDFGGGTFDASLIRYEDGKFRLLAEPAGLERCGGMDIDYLIARDMREAVEKEYPGTWDGMKKNQRRFMRFTSQLNEMAVKAKHHLSDAGAFNEYIDLGMDDVDYRLTREQFNQMAAPLLGQTVQVCQRLLKNAQMSPSDLSAVLLVGGTSRIPLVQEMAGKIMGKPPLCAADLELSVAQGALVYQYKQNEERHGSAGTVKKKASVRGDEEKDLLIGKYAERYISNYAYVKKGTGIYIETNILLFRAAAHIPVEEKVLLAVNVQYDTRNNIIGTVFTNAGIYCRTSDTYKNYAFISGRTSDTYKNYAFINGRTLDSYDGFVFTSWSKFVDSKLIMTGNAGQEYYFDEKSKRYLSHYADESFRVCIGSENRFIASFLLLRKEPMRTREAVRYEFFPELQQYLRLYYSRAVKGSI